MTQLAEVLLLIYVKCSKLTLLISALSTAIKVLASILSNPDVSTGLGVEILNVGLEVLDADIVPVDRDEAKTPVRKGPSYVDRTYSAAQSAAELPALVQAVTKSKTHWRPSGALVVAAPPNRIPLLRMGA